ncbi:MAG: GNAT family N-acetyltransferase, partial [Flavobacteriales bacterium]|nr:GNAT family N-acetyltransferase [Flavobacteriales bacterium]
MRCRNFDEFKSQLEHRQKRCPYKKSDAGLEVVLHQSLDDLDHDRWNQIVGGESIFLHTNYLFALISSYESGLGYRFACFHQGEELVGVAAFQITHFETNDLRKNMSTNPVVRLFNKSVTRNGNILRFNVLICGNAFASGDHAFRFVKGIPEMQAFNAVLQAVEMIKEKENSGENKISAVLLKDFYPESFGNTHVFSDDKYSEFLVDPNMVMPVRSEWNTFDDYLQSLTSKYRTKAKAAFKRSKKVEIKDLDLEMLKQFQEPFEKLYEGVHYKADFRVGKLNFEAFYNLKKDLKDTFLLRGFFLDDQMVGFMSGFEYNGMLDAHMVGIDYDHNYEYAIYSRMLYEYVDEAIKRNLKKISFGRTAM